MRTLHAICTMLLAAPLAIAQNCFDGDFGTLIGTNTQDTVLPIQAIGFPFPIGGTTYTDAHVTDHGFVQFSNAGTPAPATGAVLYTPSTTNFAAGSAKVAALYADIIGAGGGKIYFRGGPASCTITWINMQNFGIPSPRFSFQMTLFPSGDVRCVYGPGCTNNSTFGGVSDNGIVGVSQGGAVALPASLDLSVGGTSTNVNTYENWATANQFDMANNTLVMFNAGTGYAYLTLGAPATCASSSDYGTNCGGVAMTGFGLPSVGNSGFRLDLTAVPVTSPIAFVGFGTAVVNPGIPLAGVGMAGCNAYTNLDIGLFGTGLVTAGTVSFALGIPANPALAGVVLSSQGIALSPTTTLGLIASNGTQINLGFGN